MINKMFDEFNELYDLETKAIDHNLGGLMEVVGSEYDEMTDEFAHSLIDDSLWIPHPENFVKEGLDVIYSMAQQLRERGVDLDRGLEELHRSNMSKRLSCSQTKDEHAEELDKAKLRYPSAAIDTYFSKQSGFIRVLKCQDTGKVIKPTTYSSAVITPDMWNK